MTDGEKVKVLQTIIHNWGLDLLGDGRLTINQIRGAKEGVPCEIGRDRLRDEMAQELRQIRRSGVVSYPTVSHGRTWWRKKPNAGDP